ncbi:helix-turn-helix domain-containing protein [Sporosarcina sp. FSL K6-1508]|uniref:helix-turn-helix domain-containing protein n=1 Tax=Sporosarcina sp. FSL K6-1508 TaxID=2921553 RepID=UPI0030F61D89
MKKGRNLLDNSRLIETHPDLHDAFYGIAALYGKIVFAQRMKLGLTQKELAAKANVSIKTIARAEGGTGNLGTENYDSIFGALELNMSDVAKLMSTFAEDEHTAALEVSVY